MKLLNVVCGTRFGRSSYQIEVLAHIRCQSQVTYYIVLKKLVTYTHSIELERHKVNQEQGNGDYLEGN